MRKFSIAGVSFALLAVILGAFASHALKDHFEVGVLQSFETGIRYMMYHGLALLILSQMSRTIFARAHEQNHFCDI